MIRGSPTSRIRSRLPADSAAPSGMPVMITVSTSEPLRSVVAASMSSGIGSPGRPAASLTARVGGSATAVALVGVLLPAGLGFGYWYYFDPQIGAHPAGVEFWMVAIFVGATLTATSVGITARVLTDLDQLHTPEARVIIGAAVIDEDFEVFPFADVTGLEFETGSVATQIVLAVDGRPQRIKAPNDEAPLLRRTLEEVLFAFHDVESVEPGVLPALGLLAADVQRGARGAGQVASARQEVGVDVGLDHTDEVESEFVDLVEVLIEVSQGVDHGRFARAGTGDDVGRLGESVVVDTFEVHGVAPSLEGGSMRSEDTHSHLCAKPVPT